MSVRATTADDWQVVREVRLRALLDAPEAFHTTYAEAAALDEAGWRERLTATDRVTFVAEDGGRPVGMVVGAPAGVDEAVDDAALVLAMWAAPEVRGRGVADELVTALVGWAKEQGYERLVLWVYDAAPRAAAFYRRAGFVATGRTEIFGDDGRRLRLMLRPL